MAYLGNFSVPYSTESHVAASFVAEGHEVVMIQEGAQPALEVVDIVKSSHCDMFLHTQTYGLAASSGTLEERHDMTAKLNAHLPTAFFHLDRWWGLEREQQVSANPDQEPWTAYHHVFTADGGHSEQWKDARVNHHWLPPAVYHAEAYDGTPRREFTSDIAFVGSWRSYGHKEWEPTRLDMLHQLRRRYGRRIKFWPQRQAIRGTDLTDLYASVSVVVGDSCLAGSPTHYWSDRVPETMGRGGFLIHPDVEGIRVQHPNLVTFQPGNWAELFEKIDYYLDHSDHRERVRVDQAAHTRERHTYRNRVRTVIDTVFS